jgi:hypothetical protein
MLCLALKAVWSGCDKDEQRQCPAFRVQWAPTVTAADPAVARVNGVPIVRSQVRAEMDASGRPARAALERLIERELLAQQARRLGLHRDPAAAAAAKKTAVRRLLAETFERQYRPQDISERFLHRAYELNIRRFKRPPLRRYSHILVQLNHLRKQGKQGKKGNQDKQRSRGKQSHQRKQANEGKRKPGAGQAADARKPGGTQTGLSRAGAEGRSFAAARTLARALIATVHEKALEAQRRGTLDATSFKRLAGHIRDNAGQLPVIAESGLNARTELVAPFAETLFSLENRGQLGGPVETRFGIHLIYLMEKLPPRDISFEQALPTLRKKVFPQMQRFAFRKWMKKLKKRCPVTIYDERLPMAKRGCGKQK